MSANESKLLRRLLRPTRLTTQDVAHFMKSHAIVHGKTIGKDGKAYDQVVARILIDPDSGVWNIHYYTDKLETARRIAMKLPKHMRPWANNQMSTMSLGKQERWFNEPIFFSDRHFKVQEWQGKPSSRNIGPFWVKTNEESNNPKDDYVEILGSLVNVGEVSDIAIDSSLTA
jgi:hypothetical protein